MLWKKQRQKLGKAAFLQAVSKSPGTPDSGKEADFGTKEPGKALFSCIFFVLKNLLNLCFIKFRKVQLLYFVIKLIQTAIINTPRMLNF